MRTRHWLVFVVLGTLSLALIGAGRAKSRQANDNPVVRTKVYDLTDLVVPTRVGPGELVPMSMVQWISGVSPDAEKQVGRIAKLARLALPNESWEENAGPGAIEAYPEKCSLVIRQTEAGHRAVEELLRDIRQIDDFQIEMTVEYVELTEDAEKRCREENLGPILTPEQLQELRKNDKRFPMIVMTETGRSVNFPPGYHRLTPVASADRATVEIRIDTRSQDGPPELMLWRTLSYRFPVGKTLALIDTSLPLAAKVAMVVTPRIVPRSRS